MKSLEKIHLEITPLTKTEQGMLKGGFITSESENEAKGVYNGNCSDMSSWWNGNCACSVCGIIKPVEK